MLDIISRKVIGGEAYIDPTIQITEAIWILVLREYLSAMKDEDSAPTREPKGIAAVIAPWP